MARKLLSICFITFNDAEKLASSIPAVIKLVSELDSHTQSKIEILVSDNCSSDFPLLKEHLKNIKKLKLFQTTINTGVDINIRNCILNASGEHVWIFSADDYINSKEYLLKIVKILEDEHPDILSFKINLEPTMDLEEINSVSFLLTEDKQLQGLINSGKISTAIYKKGGDYQSCLVDADEFDGLGYFHLSYGACLHNYSKIKHLFWDSYAVYTLHSKVLHRHDYHPRFSQNAHLAVATKIFLDRHWKLRFIVKNHLIFQLKFVAQLPFKRRLETWHEEKALDYVSEIAHLASKSNSIFIKITVFIVQFILYFSGNKKIIAHFNLGFKKISW